VERISSPAWRSTFAGPSRPPPRIFPAGEPLVLATDGFMRLVDVFGAYTDYSLHAALAEGRGMI